MLNGHGNIVLIGPSGAGKTEHAGLLSGKTGRPVVDIDAQIVESEGMSITDIFKHPEMGEGYFRDAEAYQISEALSRTGRIVVPGAGAICRQENRVLIGQAACVILIDPSLSVILERLRTKTDRPLALGANGHFDPAAVTRRFNERRPLYRSVAHHRISLTREMPIDEVSRLILRVIGWK